MIKVNFNQPEIETIGVEGEIISEIYKEAQITMKSLLIESIIADKAMELYQYTGNKIMAKRLEKEMNLNKQGLDMVKTIYFDITENYDNLSMKAINDDSFNIVLTQLKEINTNTIANKDNIENMLLCSYKTSEINKRIRR